MNWLKEIVANEPVIIRVIVAVAALGTSYGLKISDDQLNSIKEFAGAAIALLSVLSARQAVTPVSKLPPE